MITGASRGLGKAIATDFVKQGADVIHVARAYGVDVADAEQVESLVSQYTSIDILVCCAGQYGPIGRLEDTDWQEWKRTIEVNLFGTVRFCQAVIPLMRKQGHGKVILMSGGGAVRPRPRFSAYATSKAAIVRFAETLAAELKDTGVDVNAVAPGMLNTELLAEVLKAGPERAGQDEYDQVVNFTDSGFSEPVRLVTFLASSASNGISGRLISAQHDEHRDLWAAEPECVTHEFRNP